MKKGIYVSNSEHVAGSVEVIFRHVRVVDATEHGVRLQREGELNAPAAGGVASVKPSQKRIRSRARYGGGKSNAFTTFMIVNGKVHRYGRGQI